MVYLMSLEGVSRIYDDDTMKFAARENPGSEVFWVSDPAHPKAIRVPQGIAHEALDNLRKQEKEQSK